ncbi:MAG TPA: metalloregulator ArsR/SmtB family transcription factor [Longimicrobiales bacterium]|nr:metalloregulator ArsR/SmtB family transcription factor [Longimicrobiales bacterium]
MVSNSALDHLFHALADPTRRRILERLREGERTVGELAEPFSISRPAISKHLAVLARAELVEREARGRETVVRLRAEPLRSARDWAERYERFWTGRLDSLAGYLEEGE